jgi:hypothetical protein
MLFRNSKGQMIKLNIHDFTTDGEYYTSLHDSIRRIYNCTLPKNNPPFYSHQRINELLK